MGEKVASFFLEVLLSEQTGEFFPVQVPHCLIANICQAARRSRRAFRFLSGKRAGVASSFTMPIGSEGLQSSAGKSRIKPGALLVLQAGGVSSTISRS